MLAGRTGKGSRSRGCRARLVVAENVRGVGGSTQDRIEEYALALLQAIREHHPNIYAGAWVNPYTAALEAGLNPDSPCYRGAMEYLQAEGALEWAEETHELVGKLIYTITLRGMQMLRKV
jgi:hypothetical protein